MLGRERKMEGALIVGPRRFDPALDERFAERAAELTWTDGELEAAIR